MCHLTLCTVTDHFEWFFPLVDNIIPCVLPESEQGTDGSETGGEMWKEWNRETSSKIGSNTPY